MAGVFRSRESNLAPIVLISSGAFENGVIAAKEIEGESSNGLSDCA
jgi:hypothetical protein